MTRVMHLVRKEFLELRQDPKLFAIVIVAPILQLTMLGYAATTAVLDVPVVVVDQDGSATSRQLITRFAMSHKRRAWLCPGAGRGVRERAGGLRHRAGGDAADWGRRTRLVQSEP